MSEQRLAAFKAYDIRGRVPEDLDVDIVGDFEPTMYGFRKDKTAGITPDDLR